MMSLYKSWCITMEMLEDRGYEIPQDHILTYDDFISYYNHDNISTTRKNMTTTIYKPSSDGGGVTASSAITIFWKDSVGTGDIQSIVEELDEYESSHAILIYTQKISTYAAVDIRQLKALKNKKIIEPFLEAELQYNITRHKDVPRHIICSNVKKQEIFEKYNVDKSKLPQIKVNDPICRYYNASKGQLIKVVRPSESIPRLILEDDTMKELYDISYRIVT